jgi:glycosyltransferase involved in cell wall biosynthesis
MGTTPPIFQTVAAWLIARLRRCPFLLEVRDLWPEFAVDMGVLKNRTLIAVARAFERWLYRRADHIVVNSPWYRTYLIEKGVPPEKVSLVANGVDPSQFDPEASGEALRSQWSQPGQFVVTYAGALGLANDLSTVLRAADRLRDRGDILFWIVGDGAERARLEAEARERKLPNVRFTGSLPKAAIKDVLAASDACVATLRNIPMFRTTYPNKVFDYMAAGRPILLGIDGVIREVVDAAGGGLFVPPGDDARLAEAVLELRSDPDRARRMGRAGREHVVRHFHREQQAREFAAVLRRVAGKERSR